MKRMRVAAIAAAAIGLFVGGAPAVAGVIFSGVGRDEEAPTPSVSSNQAGVTIGLESDGLIGRAHTDYGVNRIYDSNSNLPWDSPEHIVTSIWGETFTAQGSGMVRISMRFTIDGSVDVPPQQDYSSSTFNHFVTVLRGTEWGLTVGEDFGVVGAARSESFTFGSGSANVYDGETGSSLRFNGDIATNFTGVNSQGGRLYRSVQRDGDTFTVDSFGPFDAQQQRFLTDRVEYYIGSQLISTILYSANPAARSAYENLLSGYPILARSALCEGGHPYSIYSCFSNVYEARTIDLTFDIAAGSQFTVFSTLVAEAILGTVDFSNGVRLSSFTATGGTLASNNPQFQSLGNGSYGFQPALSGVPEPTTWSMLIAGFGMIGGALRRRYTGIAFA